MSSDNYLILLVLSITIVLFLHGRIRHDMVALGSLLACVVVGLVPGDEAFSGFANPAVITVGAVLILSRGLQTSGAVDVLAKNVMKESAGFNKNFLAILVLGAVLSAFMNNVGALALLMPIAVKLAKKNNVSVSRVLMPLAFATILGGMATLIGTPPNLIVSGFRDNALGKEYSMFAFTPVGGLVALAGIVFIVLFARKLVAKRKGSREGEFDVGAYTAELVPLKNAHVIGMTIEELETQLKSAGTEVKALFHDGLQDDSSSKQQKIGVNDVIVLQANISVAQEGLVRLGLVPVDGSRARGTYSSEHVNREVVLLPGSEVVNMTVEDVKKQMFDRVHLLAISRKNGLTGRMLGSRLQAGDVLLLGGLPEVIEDVARETKMIPLAERQIDAPGMREPIIAGGIMLFSILLSAFGLVPTPVAFMLGVLAIAMTGIVPVRRIYDAIDWSVIVLLAALLPVATAMQTTGTADLIARLLLDSVAQGNAVVALTVILVFTMFLSDVINNAATAAVMCPIALQTATGLEAAPDPFLMAVAIGASCAFLTPIGHQNNTLILGPGGFKFTDYWRLGLPLEVIIVLVSVPMLLWVWPM